MMFSMNLTFKYRLSPTSAQRTALKRTLDAARWVYNKTLEVRRDGWRARGESLSLYDTNALLPGWKADHPFLSAAYSQVLQEAQERVDLAFKAFFRRVQAGEKPGYPRFKGRERYDSFAFKQPGFGWKLLDNGRLRLSKIGDVKIKLHRPIEGTIKRLIIQCDRLGNWYACFVVELAPRVLPPSPHVTGLELGLATFATLSHGKPIDNPRFFRRDEKALAKAQRQMDAHAKGTPERAKAKRKVRHIHHRIKNRRADFAHQESRKLVNAYQVIVVEELSVANMVKHHSLAKSISDAAWSQLVQWVAYKAEDAGRLLVRVDPAYTSQDCSGCGQRVPKDLSVRVHDCPHCALVMDRDLNAALNILARGLASIGNNP
jgi:putative transposase